MSASRAGRMQAGSEGQTFVTPKLTLQVATKVEVRFTNCETNVPTKLCMKGWGLMTTAEVTLEGGQVIAIFTREFWGKGLLSNSKAVSRSPTVCLTKLHGLKFQPADNVDLG